MDSGMHEMLKLCRNYIANRNKLILKILQGKVSTMFMKFNFFRPNYIKLFLNQNL